VVNHGKPNSKSVNAQEKPWFLPSSNSGVRGAMGYKILAIKWVARIYWSTCTPSTSSVAFVPWTGDPGGM